MRAVSAALHLYDRRTISTPNDTASTRDLVHSLDLVLHLARRELAATHRRTILGWAWPVTRQLVQLTVLVFIFSTVLDLGIENYPAFIFSGLVAWSWFSTALGAASSSLISQRNLVFQSRFPSFVLPLVSIAVPLVDVLIALPILALLVARGSELSWTVVMLPLLLLIQLVLLAGIGWLTAATSVYLRDVPQIVALGLTVLFYLTPVFYPLARVPADYRWLLSLNPMAVLIESYRSVLLDGGVPDWTALGTVAGVSLLVAMTGLVTFRRLESGFVDEL